MAQLVETAGCDGDCARDVGAWDWCQHRDLQCGRFDSVAAVCRSRIRTGSSQFGSKRLASGSAENEVAPANFFDLRSQNQSFEGIGAHGPQDINLTGDGEPERLNGELVTANVLSILGVEPALGRTFRRMKINRGKSMSLC